MRQWLKKVLGLGSGSGVILESLQPRIAKHVRVLETGDVREREEAAKQLAGISDPSARQALIRAMRDPNGWVRNAARIGLGETVQWAEDPRWRKFEVIGPASKYKVLDVAGEGGFGVVYKVVDQETKQYRAIKTFRSEFFHDGTVRKAFDVEASTWVQLASHPNILSAYAVDSIDGKTCVVTDWVAPETGMVPYCVTLGDYLDDDANLPKLISQDQDRRHADQPPLDWRSVAIGICLGMEHVNTMGVTAHRDLKPNNVLIGRERVVRVADFGMASAVSAAAEGVGSFGTQASLSFVRTQGGVVCGTPGYISPEVYRGEQAGIPSDVHSFGVILWQMLKETMALPYGVRFRGSVESFLQEIYDKQSHVEIGSVPNGYDQILRKCLSFAPEDRYGSFQQLRSDLELCPNLPVGHCRYPQLLKKPDKRTRLAAELELVQARLRRLQKE